MQPVLSAGLILLTLVVSARADRIDDHVRSEMDQRRIPGVALAVLEHGKTVKTAAYGLANLELAVPVKPETVFEIGSVSKQFTATAILLLAQDGKLTVDDKISRHLKPIPPAWDQVTVRHLLTHTSGIKNYTGLEGFELRRHLTQTQFLQTIAPHPLDFQPGDSWKYCNTGYSLLGYIVENVSGTNYWAFLRERIFRPLGMHATTNRQPATVIPNRASGYEQTNHVFVNRDYDLTDVFSAGAIASTVLDLAKWDVALDGDDLLRPPTKEQMWTPACLNNAQPTKYGLGWFIDTMEGHPNIGHGGSTSGFSATIQRFPKDHLTVIILTNTDEQIAPTLAKKIASIWFQK